MDNEELMTKVAEALEPELPLKHRLGQDITRVVVGGLAGSLGALIYKKLALRSMSETEEE